MEAKAGADEGVLWRRRVSLVKGQTVVHPRTRHRLRFGHAACLLYPPVLPLTFKGADWLQENLRVTAGAQVHLKQACGSNSETWRACASQVTVL